MLRNYFPFYELALRLAALQSRAELRKSSDYSSHREIADYDPDAGIYRELLDAVQFACDNHGLTHTSKLATRTIAKCPPHSYLEIFHALDHLKDSLKDELEGELIFRIPAQRKDYFENDNLFGSDVVAAFPSCSRDIRKAGNCYAFEQEDACVHHLMLVLERGLNALAAKFQVPFDYRNWQPIISAVETKVKSLPSGDERHFYQEAVAQFGFLKDAYRNHSAHAYDNKYDFDKALSIFNHVRDFMRALAEGGLTE